MRQSWITNCDRFWITKCDKIFEIWITNCDGITKRDGLQSDKVPLVAGNRTLIHDYRHNI